MTRVDEHGIPCIVQSIDAIQNINIDGYFNAYLFDGTNLRYTVYYDNLKAWICSKEAIGYINKDENFINNLFESITKNAEDYFAIRCNDWAMYHRGLVFKVERLGVLYQLRAS